MLLSFHSSKHVGRVLNLAIHPTSFTAALSEHVVAMATPGCSYANSVEPCFAAQNTNDTFRSYTKHQKIVFNAFEMAFCPVDRVSVIFVFCG
jgi:hypothetical protein